MAEVTVEFIPGDSVDPVYLHCETCMPDWERIVRLTRGEQVAYGPEYLASWTPEIQNKWMDQLLKDPASRRGTA